MIEDIIAEHAAVEISMAGLIMPPDAYKIEKYIIAYAAYLAHVNFDSYKQQVSNTIISLDDTIRAKILFYTVWRELQELMQHGGTGKSIDTHEQYKDTLQAWTRTTINNEQAFLTINECGRAIIKDFKKFYETHEREQDNTRLHIA